jgi:predicted alpha/beta hydrolase family esterase
MKERGIEVRSPDFPGTNEPKLKTWLATARSLVPHFKPNDGWVLVGHSLGCPTILRLLESFDGKERVKAVILVAGFAKDLGIPQVRGFVEKEFGWEKIRAKAERFIVINSDNDPYIPLQEGERLAKLLGAELVVEHAAGHINEGSGHASYPLLLKILEGLGP